MSAKFDRVQGFKFYYGNAARDLMQYLPKEEATMELGRGQAAPETKHNTTSGDLASLIGLVDSAEQQINQIEQSRRHLSFLLQDLKRIIA